MAGPVRRSRFERPPRFSRAGGAPNDEAAVTMTANRPTAATRDLVLTIRMACPFQNSQTILVHALATGLNDAGVRFTDPRLVEWRERKLPQNAWRFAGS